MGDFDGSARRGRRGGLGQQGSGVGTPTPLWMTRGARNVRSVRPASVSRDDGEEGGPATDREDGTSVSPWPATFHIRTDTSLPMGLDFCRVLSPLEVDGHFRGGPANGGTEEV